MKIETKAVHAGDRKKDPTRPARSSRLRHPSIPRRVSSTKARTSWIACSGREEAGFCYSRYDNPTNAALEELVTALEGGQGALACSSGMAAMHIALLAALMDRRKSVLAASALYGATINLLMKVLEPLGIETRFVDVCNLDERAATDRGLQARLRADGDDFKSAAASWSHGSHRGIGESRRARAAGGQHLRHARCWSGRWSWERTCRCTA